MRNEKGQFVKEQSNSWTEKHRQNHRISFSKFKNENHWNWRGNDVSYKSLHSWISRNYGKANKCDDCKIEKNIEWANISKNYKRERNDWKMLCKKCHYLFDRGVWGNPNAKLLKVDIKYIQDFPKYYGSQLFLAKKFNVNPATIWLARHRDLNF